MQLQKSKLTKTVSDSSWASLLQTEIVSRETKFPKESKTHDQIAQLFKKSNFPYGRAYIDRFIVKSKAIGTIKELRGVEMRDGKLKRAVRYLIVKPI